MKRFEPTAVLILLAYLMYGIQVVIDGLGWIEGAAMAWIPALLFFLAAILSLDAKAPKPEEAERKRLIDRSILFGLVAIAVQSLLMITLFDLAAYMSGWLGLGAVVTVGLTITSGVYAVRVFRVPVPQ